MHRLPGRGYCRFRFIEALQFRLPHGERILLWLTPILLIAGRSHAQNMDTAASQFYGKGATLTVIVHDSSGNPIQAAAMVKLFRGGTIPAGQTQTDHGRAELLANDLGVFTVMVDAPGFSSAQKEVSISADGRTQVDVYLSALSSTPSAVPGRPLLAPKAKKAVDEGFAALVADNLGKAQKHAAQATLLAPGHPDVLYLQGLILLKQRDWPNAQQMLEKATQVDPSHANAFAALGMTLYDEGKYEAAIAPLEKALKLNPASSWDTRSTLARAYYRQANYDQALAMSRAALASSNGKAPEVELLVAQSLTAVGQYEDAAQMLRGFLKNHSDRKEAATARRWLDGLVANGKIQSR